MKIVEKSLYYMRNGVHLAWKYKANSLALFMVLGTLFTQSFQVVAASGPGAPQLQLYANGISGFDIIDDDCSGTGDGTGGVTTSVPSGTSAQNSIVAFGYLIDKELTPYQAAGIIGNLLAESAMLPTRQQGKSTSYIATTMIPNVGFGIAQWTSPGRQQGLAQKAQNATPPVPITDLGVQLDFLWQELNGPYKGVFQQLRATTTLRDAVSVITHGYEVPANADAAVVVRTGLAAGVLQEVGAGAAATASGATATPPSTDPTSTIQATTPNSGCSNNATLASSSTYQNPLRNVKGLVRERIDQGVDYNGSGPVFAMGDAVITNIVGSGWPGGIFIAYKLSAGPAKDKYVYFAEDCTPEAGLTIGQHVNSSTVICNMYNGDSGIETGWAQEAGDVAMASDEYIHEGFATSFGQNFSQLLQSLGAPPGTMSAKVGISKKPLPLGWPVWTNSANTVKA